jgi:hypothetical protein
LGKTATWAAAVLREMKVGVVLLVLVLGVSVVVVVTGLWGSQARKVRKVPLMLISVFSRDC